MLAHLKSYKLKWVKKILSSWTPICCGLFYSMGPFTQINGEILGKFMWCVSNVFRYAYSCCRRYSSEMWVEGIFVISVSSPASLFSASGSEHLSTWAVNSEQWAVNSEQWAVNSEQWAVEHQVSCGSNSLIVWLAIVSSLQPRWS